MEDTGLHVDVRHGTVSVLDLGTGKGQPVVEGDGPVPVRVYGFDSAQRIVSDMVMDAGGGTLVLPEDAVRAACLGLGEGSDASVHGWNRRSTLFQVGHYTMLGEGCTVRAQNSPRLRRRAAEQRRGIVSGDDLLTRNRVQQGVRSERPGWTETIFATGVQTVAVVLTKDAAADAARVKIAATGSPWYISYGGFTDPVDIMDLEDGMVMLFDTAQISAGTDLRTAVLVKGTDAMAGVYGWHTSVGEVREGWNDHRMQSLARPVPTAAERLSAQTAAPAAPGRTRLRVFRR